MSDVTNVIPKFEDLYIPLKTTFYESVENEDGSIDVQENTLETEVDPGCTAINRFKNLAVKAATDTSVTQHLTRRQLFDIGNIFKYGYSDALLFHVQQFTYNNLMLALDSNPDLRMLDYFMISDIKGVLFDMIYHPENYPQLGYITIFYKVLRATEISRYVVLPEEYPNSPDRVTKEGLKSELFIYGDTFVATLSLLISMAVEYDSDKLFYNLHHTFDQRKVEDIISKVIAIVNKCNPDAAKDSYNSPITVENRYVYACTMMKSMLMYTLMPSLANISRYLCELFSTNEFSTPFDIYESLGVIDRILEKEEKNNCDDILDTPYQVG